MNETRQSKKDKNQHIQVFVRVRPTNNAEKASKSAIVLDVTSCKDVVVKERPQDKLTKKFSFDRVFGPGSKQVEVYNAVVSPLLEEVLAGYNCTVFAYGQTGTGKTFTMEGAGNDPALHWQSDTQAGIIPRTLSHLFDELRTLDAQEYTVRVSFLELYNEELFDLLSPTDDASKIRLYEDASRKGAVVIHGLEELTVHNKSEVYKILEKGSEKRQTAATLMNAHSSRSHTVFSITVHIKENTVNGEELLKTGKLNLVDLAGSENVGRSGAVDRRAREAGNINQSLLTLGRVITALVERAPHIPYRESKLTRLLQESLGGRTKTSIIATVSPASVNLEETLSTLDYAHRAKNITNRPEINQKLSKKEKIKEYTQEIERLRRDLHATRERNGVYLAQENFNEMQTTIEIQGREIEEKINHIKALEEASLNVEKLFNDQQSELESTKNVLESTKNTLQTTIYDRDIHKHLMEKHATTEKKLYSQAQTLLKVADTATDDTYKLHDKIFRKKRVEDENENLGQQFRGSIEKRFGDIEQDTSNSTQDFVQFCLSSKDQILAQAAVNSRGTDTVVQLSTDLVQDERAVADKLRMNVNASYDEIQTWVETQVNNAARMTEERTSDLREISTNIASMIQQISEDRNRIAENLRIVKEDSAKKIDTVLTYVKDSTDTCCETLLSDRDRLSQTIVEVQESAEITERIHQQSRQDFSEAIEDLTQVFTQAFTQALNRIKNLSEKEESRNTLIINSLAATKNKFKNICQQSEENCSTRVKSEKAFKKEIQSSVDAIKSDIATSMEKNSAIAVETINQSKELANDLDKRINDNCEAFNTYKNLVENEAQDIHKRTEEDRRSIVSCTDKIEKIVSDASVNLVELVEQQRHKAEATFTDMTRKFEHQSVKSTEWNNRITSQLRTTKHEVDKFLVEDLRRDTPTGSTPAKREFQYPRKLVITSPHERIISRFRESKRKLSEESEDDEQDSTIICTDAPIKRQSGSPIRRRGSPASASKIRSSSTPYKEEPKSKYLNTKSKESKSFPLVRSLSATELPVVSRPSFENSTRSECDISIQSENKENGIEDFAKPNRKIPTKVRPSKTKIASRRVLGSYN